LDEHVEQFEACRNALLERLDEAVARFGRDAWLNPNLQPSLFTLSEAAAGLLTLGSSLRRSHVVLSEAIEPAEREETLARAGRLTHRLREEIDALLRRFDEEFDALRHGFYPASIRAAAVAFRAGHVADRLGGRLAPRVAAAARGASARHWQRSDPIGTLRAKGSAPCRVLVVLEPRPTLSPEPMIREGRLAEPHYRLRADDAAALQAALEMAETGHVQVTVAAVGPRRCAGVLREALALGADAAILVAAPHEPVDPAAACEALAATLAEKAMNVDVLLARPADREGDAGWLGVLLAARLGIPWYGSRRGLALDVRKGKREVILAASGADGVASRRVFEPIPLPAACAIEAASEQLAEFTTTGWLASLGREFDVRSWPAHVACTDTRVLAAEAVAQAAHDEAETFAPRSAAEAAAYFAELAGLQTDGSRRAGRVSVPAPDEEGNGEAASLRQGEPAGGPDLQHVECDLDADRPFDDLAGPCVLGVALADRDGRLSGSEQAVLALTKRLAEASGATAAAIILHAGGGSADERLSRQLAEAGIELSWLWAHRHLWPAVPQLARKALEAAWGATDISPAANLRAVVAGSWAGESLAALAERSGNSHAQPAIVLGATACEVLRGTEDDGVRIAARVPLGEARLARQVRYDLNGSRPVWIGLGESFSTDEPGAVSSQTRKRPIRRFTSRVPLEEWFSRETVARVLRAARAGRNERGGLAAAEIVVDVGSGVRNRDQFEEVIDPLVAALERLGIGSVEVGGSRKVTEELGLLPADRQIGQTGQSVNPKLLLAIGVSGAPQHLGYIGPRATIFSFNRDPEAPIMTLNRRTPQPRVVPILGDLFKTVPEFLRALVEMAGRRDAGELVSDKPSRTTCDHAEVGAP
jgi:hypothetical protein